MAKNTKNKSNITSKSTDWLLKKQISKAIKKNANTFNKIKNEIDKSLSYEEFYYLQDFLYEKLVNDYKILLDKLEFEDTKKSLKHFLRLTKKLNLLLEVELLKQNRKEQNINYANSKRLIEKYSNVLITISGILIITLLLTVSYFLHTSNPDSWLSKVLMGIASGIVTANIVVVFNKIKNHRIKSRDYKINRIQNNLEKFLTEIKKVQSKIKISYNKKSYAKFFSDYIKINSITSLFISNTLNTGLEQLNSYIELIKSDKKIFRSIDLEAFKIDDDSEVVENVANDLMNNILELDNIVLRLENDVRNYISELNYEKDKIKTKMF